MTPQLLEQLELRQADQHEAIQTWVTQAKAMQSEAAQGYAAQRPANKSELISKKVIQRLAAPVEEIQSKQNTPAKEFVFSRSEKKYLISYATAETLIHMLKSDLAQDKRGSTLIRNLYLDTPDLRLIRRSMEKPFYKEKLRIRTYGEITGPEHEAFLEIKKKLKGQVHKRRLALPLGEVEGFIQGRAVYDSQIGRELAWSIQSYSPLQPAISVVYDRCAYAYPGLEGTVRITIDCNVAAKAGNKGDFFAPIDDTVYTTLLPENHCIMEVKALGGLPLELVKALSALEIYPASFSKVGTAYTRVLAEQAVF